MLHRNIERLISVRREWLLGLGAGMTFLFGMAMDAAGIAVGDCLTRKVLSDGGEMLRRVWKACERYGTSRAEYALRHPYYW